MKVVVDLEIHSKYARAVSPQMNVATIAEWAVKKGIDLVGTGDFTHPMWLRELKANLKEVEEGIYTFGDQRFLLTSEVSCMYTHNGKGRRVHLLVYLPSFSDVEKFNSELSKRGANLFSDGRPIIGMSLRQVAEIALSVNPKALLIPAHCLLPETRLEIVDGLKKIEEFSVGDKVMTHKGRYRKVKEVTNRSYKGEVIWIRPWYFSLGLKTTPEHPFFAIKTVKKCKSTGDICRPFGGHLKRCHAKHYNIYKKEWIPAKDLEIGDLVLFPRTTKVRNVETLSVSQYVKDFTLVKNDRISLYGSRSIPIPDTIPVDAGFLRLVGYYLAEGYTTRDDISFALHINETDVVEDIKIQMKRLFGLVSCRQYKRKGYQSVELIFQSKILSTLFSKLFYQSSTEKRANSKGLPNWMLFLHPSRQKEIFKGWWIGDKGYTSSRVLMNQMKIICLRLGIIPSVTVDTREAHKRRGKHDKFEGRKIVARHDNYYFHNLTFFGDEHFLLKESVFFEFKTKLERRHGWIDKRYVYLPIRTIEKEGYSGKVYNLEVEDDNSYVSEFATVHNCWTPWFGLYGSKSGYDSLEEAFGDLAKFIPAVETGLSSDPAMNWRIAELDNRSIVSFSDAHSPPKLGREATVFELPDPSYENIRRAIQQSDSEAMKQCKIAYTIEFYPEEGKYHYTGHRNCKVVYSPEETKKAGTICPVCGKGLTVGVMNRVDTLGKIDLPTGEAGIGTEIEKDEFDVRWIMGKRKARPKYVMLVPLLEILAEALLSTVSSQKVLSVYDQLVNEFGGEFNVLLKTKLSDIQRLSGQRISEGIKKVREGDIVIEPGYDGVFGKVKIWSSEALAKEGKTTLDQGVLF